MLSLPWPSSHHPLVDRGPLWGALLQLWPLRAVRLWGPHCRPLGLVLAFPSRDGCLHCHSLTWGILLHPGESETSHLTEMQPLTAVTSLPAARELLSSAHPGSDRPGGLEGAEFVL